MTETATTGILPRDHDQPCYCDICFVTTIQDQITNQAILLRAALDDHVYENGFERTLADVVFDAIPAARRPMVLQWMVEWEHLQPRVMVVDCLLDETDSRSYEALAEMAKILLAAIYAQDSAPHALRYLLRSEICENARLLAVRHQANA